MMKASLPDSIQTWMKELIIARAEQNETVMDRLPEQHVQRFEGDLERLIDAIIAADVQTVVVTHANRFGNRVAPDEHHALVGWRKFYPGLG